MEKVLEQVSDNLSVEIMENIKSLDPLLYS